MEMEEEQDKKKASTGPFNPLDYTASLGYQTHRRAGRNSWSKEDDEKLRRLINDAVVAMGYINGIDDVRDTKTSLKVSKEIPWDSLASFFNQRGRTGKDLRKRWSGSLDPNVKKGRWKPEEDKLLLQLYEKYGPHWMAVSMEIASRTEDQCAKRYTEVLGPSSKGRLREWAEAEDLLLISKVKKYGTKWRKISSEMESRPSLTCRNRWRKIVTMIAREQASEVITKAVKENQAVKLGPAEEEEIRCNKTDRKAGKRKRPVEERLEPNRVSLGSGEEEEEEEEAGEEIDEAEDDDDDGSSSDNGCSAASNQPLESQGNLQYPHATDHALRDTHNEQYSLGLRNQHRKKTAPSSTQTEWKFVLKDGKSLSISNGTISNTQLVKELVEQARKYDLKVSIHQHIHHHYGSQLRRPNEFDSQNAPLRSMSSNYVHQFHRSTTPPVPTSLSSTNISALNTDVFDGLVNQTNTINENQNGDEEDRKTPYESRENDFLSKTPNFNNLGLELSPAITGHLHNHSHDMGHLENNGLNGNLIHDSNKTNPHPNSKSLFYPNDGTPSSSTNIIAPTLRSNHTTGSSSTGSYSTPGSELPDVGPNRSAHFNYLPPTIRPQLDSSDNTRSADLSKLLNPTPGQPSPQGRRSKKRRRTRAKGLGSEPNSSNSTNTNTPLSTVHTPHTTNDHPVPQTSPGTMGSTVSSAEDGVDFWETLSSLANNKNIHRHQHHHSGDDRATGLGVEQVAESPNYELFTSLLGKAGPRHEDHTYKETDDGKHSDTNDSIDPLLPLNPS